MNALFRLAQATAHDPAVAAWFAADEPMRLGARAWFERLRAAGADTRELIHEGHPTACGEDAAYAYVAAYAQHAAIGFYEGASLPDPAGLLDGTGKRMRHVKLRWGAPADEAAIGALIEAAYRDLRERLDRAQAQAPPA